MEPRSQEGSVDRSANKHVQSMHQLWIGSECLQSTFLLLEVLPDLKFASPEGILLSVSM